VSTLTRLLGRYRIEELLGSGAFATVHAAHDEQLDDRVAVKLLAHNHAANPEVRQRFIAEGQVLRRLHSPHIITVHDLAESDDGRPFMVLELCDRGTLRHRVLEARQSGWRPTDADAVALALPLAAAIDAMHTAQVVHRDLTPANVLLSTAPPHTPATTPPSTLIQPGERLVVADLGFCKDLSASTGITAAGGTDGFQPPEQRAVGGRIDVRSDLYAASAVLTWALAGEVATSPRQAVAAMVRQGVSRPVASAIADALDADPDRRAQTAAAWLTAVLDAADAVDVGMPPLQPGADGHAPRRTVKNPVVIAAGLLGVVVVAGLLWGGGDRPTAEELATNDPLFAGDADADLDELAGATGQPAYTPEPTPSPPFLGPRVQGEWTFELTTEEGWRYNVTAVADIAVYLGKDITVSPPGRARLASTVDGAVDVQSVGTVDGRQAPRLGNEVFLYFNGGPEARYVRSAGLCGTPQSRGVFPETTSGYLVCAVETLHINAGELYVSDDDMDEATLDAVLAATSELTPEYIRVDLHGGDYCHVLLYPDGTVELETTEYRQPDCTVTTPD
jgi:eukaryotic-like serine/threonine-protein kinase